MKYLFKHTRDCVTIIVLIVIGVLLLVNPAVYAASLVRVVGALLAVLGLIRIVRYFRTEAKEAAKGDDFSTGLIEIIVGVCCVFGQEWLVGIFSVLAVFYGLFQLLLGFRRIQDTIDSLRMKTKMWYLRAGSALLYLIFGLVIVSNLEMAPIWIFTGITLIIEGIADAATLWMMRKE